MWPVFQSNILEVSSEVASWMGIRPVLACPFPSEHWGPGPLIVALCRVCTSGSTIAMRMLSRHGPVRGMKTPRKRTSLTQVRDWEWEELQSGVPGPSHLVLRSAACASPLGSVTAQCAPPSLATHTGASQPRRVSPGPFSFWDSWGSPDLSVSASRNFSPASAPDSLAD